MTQKYNAYVLSNPVNPASYSHFLLPNVQSKTIAVRCKTLREGIRNGFLDSIEFSMSPLGFEIEGEWHFAVIREGRECLVRKIEPSDIPLKISCYPNGQRIISDIDLVAIYLPNNSDQKFFDETYGEVTLEERVFIEDLNQRFQRGAMNQFRLISHGPANRFEGAKRACLHFPMKVHTPSSIEFLQDMGEFMAFMQTVEGLGYRPSLNPKWGL